MCQVHKDHGFAENPMEREDEQSTVKIEGDDLQGLKEARRLEMFFKVSLSS